MEPCNTIITLARNRLVLSFTFTNKQAERLKSRERRPEGDRLDGQWA